MDVENMLKVTHFRLAIAESGIRNWVYGEGSVEATQFSVMGKKRILAIDDEPTVRTIVQCCLEDLAGWEVVSVGSGAEGLVEAISNPPDAIVLDMMMPGMDGITFLKELQAKPDLPPIPVVILSAKFYTNDLPLLDELGVVGVISKPFDALTICEQIAAFLGWTLDV
jgi:CheY-like chemotaxis protein